MSNSGRWGLFLPADFLDAFALALPMPPAPQPFNVHPMPDRGFYLDFLPND